MNNQLSLSLAYLYPRSMNIYGDRGNIITLVKRCQWHGIKPEVTEIEVSDSFSPQKYDIIFAGGGQDNHQLRVAKDLQERKHALSEAVEQGSVFLLICGSYQLFGHYFKTHDGTEIPGISVLDAYTVASDIRKIGNVIIQSSIDLHSKLNSLVGFENHSGNTYITNTGSTKPLGTVSSGYGNNGRDKTEGAYCKNCFGTYLHGSLLPKNPHFADFLIRKALERKYKEAFSLKKLNDSLELEAHSFVLLSRNKPV